MEFTSFAKGRADPSHLLPNCYSHHQCTDLSHKPKGLERAATYKEVTLILVLKALGIWNCVFALNKTGQYGSGSAVDHERHQFKVKYLGSFAGRNATVKGSCTRDTELRF